MFGVLFKLLRRREQELTRIVHGVDELKWKRPMLPLLSSLFVPPPPPPLSARIGTGRLHREKKV